MNHTISAILRGQWLIDRSYAHSHLPVVLGILQGKLSGAEFFTGSAEHEQPFIINGENKRVPAYVYNWKTGQYEVNEKQITAGSVVVIPIIGPVIKYNGSCGESGMVKRQAWTNELINIDNVVGLISYIDSPGGQADGTPQFTDFISSIQKNTIAVVEGGAYSAGAWIASGHDAIYAANKHSNFGSIGAYTTIMDFRGYFEQQGIKVQEFYPKISRDKNRSYREARDGNPELLIEEITDLAQTFIDSISENRGGKLTSDEWNTGKVFNAAQSIDIGLIDGIKSLTEAVAAIRGPKISAPIISSKITPDKTSLNQNNTTMNFPNLVALATNAAPTEEQVELANGDLRDAGINNYTLVEESFINEASNVSAENVRLRDEATNAATTLSTAQADLATAKTDLTAKAARISELEAQMAKMPGAAHNTEANDKDRAPEGEDSAQSIMDSLPHNQRADNNGF